MNLITNTDGCNSPPPKKSFMLRVRCRYMGRVEPSKYEDDTEAMGGGMSLGVSEVGDKKT